MKHKKESAKKGHSKMGKVEPMAHGAKSEHLKPVKKGHKSVSGK